MENQFSLTGLVLLTPEIKELINLSESADFRAVKKMRIDEMRAQIAQYEQKLIRLEAAGLMLPGAWEAVAPKLETILATYESGLKTDNETALRDAQESDCKTVQDAYNDWLYTARPTPAQALVGAAKMRAEMRAAGIIEASPNLAPVSNAVAASSPARPDLAGAAVLAPGATSAPTVTLPAAPAPTAPNKLSLRQVALLHVYNRKVIPTAANEIAQRYGYTSGAKLYNHYRTVSQRAGRIGDEITGQKLKPMIADISALIPHLTGPPRQQAESELQTLLARKEEK